MTAREQADAHTRRLGGIAGQTARRGREQVWDLEPSRLEDAHAYLDRISAQWDTALARLKLFVEE